MDNSDGFLILVFLGGFFIGILIFSGPSYETAAEAVCESHGLELLKHEGLDRVVCFDGSFSSQSGLRVFEFRKGGN